MPTVSEVLEELLADDIVDAADIARAVGTTASSVTRWRAGDSSPTPETELRLFELSAILSIARKHLRPESARLWLRSPDPDLRYDKPLDLVAVGRYHEAVGALLAVVEGVTS